MHLVAWTEAVLVAFYALVHQTSHEFCCFLRISLRNTRGMRKRCQEEFAPDWAVSGPIRNSLHSRFGIAAPMRIIAASREVTPHGRAPPPARECSRSRRGDSKRLALGGNLDRTG